MRPGTDFQAESRAPSPARRPSGPRILGSPAMHLLACPDCARQYDVTELALGERVRCACDAVLSVPPPPKLSAQAFVCTNCGGVLGVLDEACPYCAAEISERDRRESTVCPACFVRISAEARHCRGCGLRIEPQALRPIPAGRACPRCSGALQHLSIGRSNVIECSVCRGLWLEPAVFAECCQLALTQLDALAVQGQSEPRARITDELCYIPCVQCGELMTRRRFLDQGRASSVILDSCRKHGVWLDDAELAKIADFLRLRARPQLFGAPASGRPGSLDAEASAVLEQELARARDEESPWVRAGADALALTFAYLGSLLKRRA